MEFLESIAHIEYCYDYVINQISVNLLFYSHIPTALTAFLFGLFLVVKKRSAASVSLFVVCFCFALWCILDLVTWFVFIGAQETMFAWSLIDLTGLIFFFFAYRFLYAYIYDTDIPLWQLIIGFLLIAPTIVTTLLGLNLTGFDANICEAVESENIVSYTYLAQFIFLCAVCVLGIVAHRKATDSQKKKQIALASIGVFLFLFFFFTAAYSVVLLINYTAVDYAYNYGIYGLFGMPVLLIYLGYLIVKFQAFNVKLIGAQALILTLVCLVGAQLFLAVSTTDFIINAFTTLLVVVFGYFLVRSVQREIKQREQIEKLATDLAVANNRLRVLDKMKSEFVSIASHQLRSPLTAIRGYASMLLEKTYGELPEKAVEPVSRIEESSRFMALSVDDFLNVSRIEAGQMKYESAEFSLRETAEAIANDLRPAAEKKGLVLTFRNDAKSDLKIKADPGKVRQIIQNMVDNAMKYTPKGSVTVVAHDNPQVRRAYISIIDTGIGLSPEMCEKLFEKFARAQNANSVNVHGTGLGLYIAKQMAEAMGGTITVSSQGEGKGSTFRLEMPLQ